jgi:hypothetical protein
MSNPVRGVPDFLPPNPQKTRVTYSAGRSMMRRCYVSLHGARSSIAKAVIFGRYSIQLGRSSTARELGAKCRRDGRALCHSLSYVIN